MNTSKKLKPTNQQINELIVQSLGWAKVNENGKVYWYTSNANSTCKITKLPNYASCPYTMRKFMLSLSPQKRVAMTHHMYTVEIRFMCDMLTITPRQIAECYLRYKGLWPR